MMKKEQAPADDIHKALLVGFKKIISKARPRYHSRLSYSDMLERWKLSIVDTLIYGNCTLYIEGDKLIIGVYKKTVLDLNDPEMDTQVVPTILAAFNQPAGSYWTG